MDQLLTIKDIADRAKVTTRTVQRWQQKGLIAFIKLPQGIRFREEHFENWLNRKTVKEKKQAS
jgi:excisionase family DNA binding protein